MDIYPSVRVTNNPHSGLTDQPHALLPRAAHHFLALKQYPHQKNASALTPTPLSPPFPSFKPPIHQ